MGLPSGERILFTVPPEGIDLESVPELSIELGPGWVADTIPRAPDETALRLTAVPCSQSACKIFLSSATGGWVHTFEHPVKRQPVRFPGPDLAASWK